MTKEEQAVLDAKAEAEAKAKEDAQDDSSQEDAGDDSSESSSKDKVDYKALLQAEKDRAEKAEKALAEDRYKTSKKKREDKEESSNEDETDENRLPTVKELQTILARERQATQKTFEESRALEIARSSTSSEDEAQTALLFWKTRVIPTGNLEEDINFAVAGLNHRKTVAEKSELMRALRAKDGISRETATTFRDATPGTSPKLSSGDAAAYKRAGFAFDNTSKVWKKKLPNGKFLIKDPRTKQTRVE